MKVKIGDKEIKEAKSLRWLANQFPKVENPKNNGDRLCNCINLYCTNGAELIEKLYEENEILQINAANAFQEGLNENKALFEKEILEQFVQKLKTRADELKQVSIDGQWAISQYDIDRVLKETVVVSDG